MGSIIGGLFGGSSSKSSSTQSGFGGLPASIQNAFTNLATQGTNTLAPTGGSPNASLFTLPSLNPSSQNALSQVQNQDFAITPQSIQTGINEQTNPYDSSVINQIERAQNGNLSQLNQYLTNAGQFGSNRGMLGASDISQTAADQIGAFKNAEFQQALQNALTTIPQTNAQSAQGSIQAGQFQQGQQLQNQQAPVSALAALSSIMGVLPTTSNQASSSSSSQAIRRIIMGLFDSSPQLPVSSTSPLTQLLSLIQHRQTPVEGAQQPGNAQAPAVPSNNSGVNLQGMLTQAGNLQSLPWLSPTQNAASMTSAMGDSAGALGGSALSALASLFL